MEESKTTNTHAVIPISSSSSPSPSSSSGEECFEESQSESEDSDSSSEFSVEEISSSTCDDAENDDDDDDDGGGEEGNEGKDEDSMSRRVVHFLREKRDMAELTLVECKAYLRRHGLRLSGTRAECVQRIKEHWRIRDGRGEILYPRSSFTIDCTGDVCRGDVVLFTQKVYKKFDKVTRSGNLLGKRTVVGRIVKESYGAAKQQHTFTVEVLWSKGVKELPPLFPLLVKGRNLYRMKTFRQSWKNEKERLEVLSEKHKRGAAARQIREMQKTKAVKRKRKRSSTHEVSKHQKRFLHSSIPERSQRRASKQESHLEGHGKAPAGKQKSKFSHRNAPPFGKSNFKGKGKFSAPASQRRHQNYHRPDVGESSVRRSFSHSQSKQYHQEPPCFFSSENTSASASAKNWRPYASNSNPFCMPFSARHELVNHDIHPNHGCSINAGRRRDGNYSFASGGAFQQFHYTSRQ